MANTIFIYLIITTLALITSIACKENDSRLPLRLLGAVARFNVNGERGDVVFVERAQGSGTWVRGLIRGVYCVDSANGTLNRSISDRRVNCRLGIHVHVNPPTVTRTCGRVGSREVCTEVLNCTACGGHYNPTIQTHGSATSAVRHIGDLGNASVRDGRAKVALQNVNVPLTDAYSIIGRCLVLHAHTDDLGLGTGESPLNGNSDGRLACALIEAFDAY